MNLMALYRENKIVKLVTNVGAVVGALSAITTAWLALDARYVKAADFSSYQQRQEQLSQRIMIRQDLSTAQTRVQQLEDKLFELRQIGRRTASQEALMQRYEDQLRAAQEAVRDAEKSLREIERTHGPGR
jgi:chromosome segregation ATPase